MVLAELPLVSFAGKLSEQNNPFWLAYVLGKAKSIRWNDRQLNGRVRYDRYADRRERHLFLADKPQR